ncbi:hypothetical protein [Agaribacterium sp. ZY112]|uniref:hypothetical protein n=1 Tax=Agaribacterium sp. ZY112 TaxID=3233574 RepID=UPI00352541DD
MPRLSEFVRKTCAVLTGVLLYSAVYGEPHGEQGGQNDVPTSLQHCDMFVEQLMSADGDEIGYVNYCYREQGAEIIREMSINIRWAFYRYRLHSIDHAFYSSGGLQRLRSRIDENDSEVAFLLERSDQGWHLQSHYDAKRESNVIAQAEHEVLDSRLFFRFLLSGKDKARFTVLDLDDFSVKDVDLYRVGKDLVKVANVQYSCEKIRVDTSAKNSVFCLMEVNGRLFPLWEQGEDDGEAYLLSTKRLNLGAYKL